jgi:hypothetical protein
VLFVFLVAIMKHLFSALVLATALPVRAETFASLESAGSVPGYVARLLINETPFPGEKGYVSVDDTKAAMLSILWVLESRLKYIPTGYRQEQIAAVRADNIIDIITAGGEKGQCDGFYRDPSGRPASVPRVEERITYLLKIANSGGKPGKFAELLNYGQGLARAYVGEGVQGADRFAGLNTVNRVAVTGRAYSWMTDRDYYNPGGSFVSIPDAENGSLGGNRFFTLEKHPE